MKGANDAVRDFFMGNMSSRAAKMLTDDMAAAGPVRLRDVDEAQASLVNLAKDLAAKGEIMLQEKPRRRRAGLLMGAPAKFLFDVDFAVPEAEKERALATAEVALRIAESEARGYRAGFDAAQREAKAESDRRTALAFEEMAMSMRSVASRFGDIEQRMETEAVDVAVAVCA